MIVSFNSSTANSMQQVRLLQSDLMFIQVFSLCHIVISYVCFDNLLCLMNLHAATQFRILQYRLTHLGQSNKKQPNENYSKNCYTVFKQCIEEHENRINYCQKLNHIFTGIVLGHLLVFSLLMCLVGFQVIMVSSLLILWYERCI